MSGSAIKESLFLTSKAVMSVTLSCRSCSNHISRHLTDNSTRWRENGQKKDNVEEYVVLLNPSGMWTTTTHGGEWRLWGIPLAKTADPSSRVNYMYIERTPFFHGIARQTLAMVFSFIINNIIHLFLCFHPHLFLDITGVPHTVAKPTNGYNLFHLGYPPLQGVASFVTAQCIYNLLLQWASVIQIFSMWLQDYLSLGNLWYPILTSPLKILASLHLGIHRFNFLDEMLLSRNSISSPHPQMNICLTTYMYTCTVCIHENSKSLSS